MSAQKEKVVRDGWEVSLPPCGSDDRVIVTITDEERAPMRPVLTGTDAEGAAVWEDCRDWSEADWPSVPELDEAATELLGRPVTTKFLDGCDGRLDEAVFRVSPSPYRWVVEFHVDETWVTDGFDLTVERAREMLGKVLPYAYSHELAACVLESPDPLRVRRAQGYRD